MNITAEKLIKDSLVGKTVRRLGFGDDGIRKGVIGKKIIKVRFGFNDGREDSGLLLEFENCDEPIYIYSNEEIEVD